MRFRGNSATRKLEALEKVQRRGTKLITGVKENGYEEILGLRGDLIDAFKFIRD